MRNPQAASLILCLFFAASAWGQIVVPGADDSDGAFNPTSNTVINLANSPTAAWDAPNPEAPTQNPLTGVYDADKWAVVFRFSSVNIPSNVTVTFANHPSRAPVVWLVSGNVTIAGTVALDGTGVIAPGSIAEPGPGGFRGGRGHLGTNNRGSSGFGPGGGRFPFPSAGPSYGSYATLGLAGIVGPTYGNQGVMPLIGGSGSSANTQNTFGGSSAGGAILVACSNQIVITGTVSAQGSAIASGFGAGGAIRLVANQVSGAGILRARGGFSSGIPQGGDGRIRIESNNITLTLPGDPAYSADLPGDVATIWPPAGAPTIKATLLGGQSVPADPRASLDFPSADVALTDPNPVTIQLECTNVPTSGSTVTVRVVPKSGVDFSVNAAFVSGDVNNSVWQAQVQLADGFSAIQARAVLP